jgi:hypothetical protein
MQNDVGRSFPAILPLPKMHSSASGVDTTPQGYYRGAELFEQALAGADDEQFEKAAQCFLDSAQAFTAGPDDEMAAGVQRCRELSYNNAWQCFRANGSQESGKAQLLKAAQNDPALSSFIKSLIS